MKHLLPPRNAGFTLVEILVSIAILILIIGGGIATYMRFNENQKLLVGGKDVQLYMRSAQKKARVGDQPTGCEKLLSHGLVVQSGQLDTVQLQAVCSNQTYTIDSYVLPSGVTFQAPLNMQFLVLQGGVSQPGTVSIISASRTFSFVVDSGGQIGEATVTNNQ